MSEIKIFHDIPFWFTRCLFGLFRVQVVSSLSNVGRGYIHYVWNILRWSCRFFRELASEQCTAFEYVSPMISSDLCSISWLLCLCTTKIWRVTASWNWRGSHCHIDLSHDHSACFHDYIHYKYEWCCISLVWHRLCLWNHMCCKAKMRLLESWICLVFFPFTTIIIYHVGPI